MNKIDEILRKYPEVYRHSCAVRDLATNFAFFLGYSYQEAMKIRLGAYIHDIGKSFIEADILLKEERLTKEEYMLIQTHSSLGYRYLIDNFSFDKDVLAIALHHHERIDGKGYPHSLKEDEIHPYAKIVSLCDVYDAITSRRCYKVAYSANYALHAIEEELGTQFDKELGVKFLSFMKNHQDPPHANYSFTAHSM